MESENETQPDSQPAAQEVTLDVFRPPRLRKGLGLVSWHSDVELGRDIGNERFLDSTQAQGSVASHSSVVNDHGDARQLSENRGGNAVRAGSGYGSSTADLVAHSGAGFTSADTLPSLEELDISALGKTEQLDQVSAHGLQTESTIKEDLGESIRAALQRSAVREGKYFLPIDALERIVTKKRIRQELANLSPNRLPEQLDSLTAQIWEVKPTLHSKASSKKTTRRKLFAILALIEKLDQIVEFIDAGLYDSDLPFILSTGFRKGLRQLDRKGEDGKLHFIQLFAQWKTIELEYFNNSQWELLAPYFHLSTKKDPKILHYNLENETIMPFTEDHEVKHTGGYGDVWKVKIHPAHHNHCDDSAIPTENPSYAVKKLRHHNYDAFDVEVSNLKRFSAKDHLHLIKLLVTYSWREHYYLLFPWADGNLKDFWEQYPKPSTPRRDYQLTLWFAKQCRGIAEGLKMIHTLDMPDTEDLHPAAAHQTHGRHGDLKPENILWFKEYQDKDPGCQGVLKISDFGLTRFHGTRSKSHIDADRVAVTGTYRAPEYDVNKVVSQSYDVWTLGCVFLEFVTWYLLGWEEVDKFSRSRMEEHVSEVKEDVFFNFVNMRDDHGRTQTGARAKHSVADEFQNLYQHRNCSDYLMDFLEFIQKSLLRMGPTNRAECDEIVQKLTALEEKCSSDRQYCTLRLKKPPARSDTELSLLKPAPLEFSPDMEKRINRTPLPLYTAPVETHAGPSSGQSFVTNSSNTSSGSYVISERIHHEPDRMEPLAESRTQEPAAVMALRQRVENEATPSSSSHIDPLSTRAASSSRSRTIQFASGRTKDKLASRPDLQDIPAGDEFRPEIGLSTSVGTSPRSSGNSMMPPPLAPHPSSVIRKFSNGSAGGAESSIRPALAGSTTSEHENPAEERPAVEPSLGDSGVQDKRADNTTSLETQTAEIDRPSDENKDPETNAALHNASPLVPSNETNGHIVPPEGERRPSANRAKPKAERSSLKGFFSRLCCIGEAD